MSGAYDLYSSFYLGGVFLAFATGLVLAVLLCGVALAARRYLLAATRHRELQTGLLLADLEADAATGPSAAGPDQGPTGPSAPPTA
ncbi:hypothetical protein [Frigoribacterium salinisoli]